MTISVFIDNNVWDFLFKHQLDLSVELPKPEFSLGITREAEFEHRPLQRSKPDLWVFIQSSMRDATVVEDSYFGFGDPSLPANEQRVSGFNVGRWISPNEQRFIDEQNRLRANTRGEPKASTRLYKNEADIALAARSFHSVVLTLDAKPGPLKDARMQGGWVVFLNVFDPDTERLSDVVRAAAK